MQRLIAVAVLVLLAWPAWSQDKNDAKKELEKLQGEWKQVGGEGRGNALGADDVANTTLTIKGNEYSYDSPAEKEKGKLTLKPGATPAEVDLDITEGASKGEKQLGIYELKGNRLKFCVNEAGQSKRPTKFATSADDTFLIFEFEKVKK
jgi:uncharacterized protein (TIGR03067 family)